MAGWGPWKYSGKALVFLSLLRTDSGCASQSPHGRSDRSRLNLARFPCESSKGNRAGKYKSRPGLSVNENAQNHGHIDRNPSDAWYVDIPVALADPVPQPEHG